MCEDEAVYEGTTLPGSVTAIIDIAACTSCVGNRTAKKLVKTATANGHRAQELVLGKRLDFCGTGSGHLKANIEIVVDCAIPSTDKNAHPCTLTFPVLEGAGEDLPALIGLAYLTKHKCILDIGNNRLIYPNGKVQIILASDSVEVPLYRTESGHLCQILTSYENLSDTNGETDEEMPVLGPAPPNPGHQRTHDAMQLSHVEHCEMQLSQVEHCERKLRQASACRPQRREREQLKRQQQSSSQSTTDLPANKALDGRTLPVHSSQQAPQNTAPIPEPPLTGSRESREAIESAINTLRRYHESVTEREQTSAWSCTCIDVCDICSINRCTRAFGHTDSLGTSTHLCNQVSEQPRW